MFQELQSHQQTTMFRLGTVHCRLLGQLQQLMSRYGINETKIQTVLDVTQTLYFQAVFGVGFCWCLRSLDYGKVEKLLYSKSFACVCVPAWIQLKQDLLLHMSSYLIFSIITTVQFVQYLTLIISKGCSRLIKRMALFYSELSFQLVFLGLQIFYFEFVCVLFQ